MQLACALQCSIGAHGRYAVLFVSRLCGSTGICIPPAHA